MNIILVNQILNLWYIIFINIKKIKNCEEYFNYFSIKNANMIFVSSDTENLRKELKV